VCRLRGRYRHGVVGVARGADRHVISVTWSRIRAPICGRGPIAADARAPRDRGHRCLPCRLLPETERESLSSRRPKNRLAPRKGFSHVPRNSESREPTIDQSRLLGNKNCLLDATIGTAAVIGLPKSPPSGSPTPPDVVKISSSNSLINNERTLSKTANPRRRVSVRFRTCGPSAPLWTSARPESVKTAPADRRSAPRHCCGP
jgi:hypothetical protein